uniref:Uncharacterized protein n=1 Tax=Rhizophora mucronata TaxID=61149 RepID=A0A2P2M2I4_RHIMU
MAFFKMACTSISSCNCCCNLCTCDKEKHITYGNHYTVQSSEFPHATLGNYCGK